MCLYFKNETLSDVSHLNSNLKKQLGIIEYWDSEHEICQ